VEYGVHAESHPRDRAVPITGSWIEDPVEAAPTKWWKPQPAAASGGAEEMAAVAGSYAPMNRRNYSRQTSLPTGGLTLYPSFEDLVV